MFINDSITLDMPNHDRFELINAYLDGEVTANERQQIDHWLTTDSEVQCLYSRAVRLRQKWQLMSSPAQQPTASKGEQIFLYRKTKSKTTMLWETILLAAALFGVLLVFLPERQSSVLPMAQDLQLTVKTEP